MPETNATGVTLFEAADAGPVPIAFVALTVNIYAVPFESPDIVIGLDAAEPVKPPGVDVAVYEVIALPPFDAGAEKFTVAEASPAVAVTPVGAPGGVTVEGVTLFEAADAGPVPIALVAFTLNVYAVPFVSPDTVIGLDAAEPVNPPGLDVVVYEVIALPPFDAGAVKLTIAEALPATALTLCGAPGVAAGQILDMSGVPTQG